MLVVLGISYSQNRIEDGSAGFLIDDGGKIPAYLMRALDSLVFRVRTCPTTVNISHR